MGVGPIQALKVARRSQRECRDRDDHRHGVRRLRGSLTGRATAIAVGGLSAADLPESAARVVCATQKPVHNSVFAATIDSPAWKTIPSWYLVSKEDHALNPDLERFYAKRMGAKTSEIDASHVAFISHPKVVAKLIEQAAATVEKSGQ
jgi:pimeloyl-ACP methyl ester carboxylesterase